VLVALAVFCGGGRGADEGQRIPTDLSRQIEDKTFAHWVALNQITEMQLRQRLAGCREKSAAASPMAGRQWEIIVKTSADDGNRHAPH
jgi:general secretion pathway protein I